MKYSKIAVMAAATLISTGTTTRAHMFEDNLVMDRFHGDKDGRGILVAQPMARAANADTITVAGTTTVTVTKFPDYCTSTPMIPLVISSTTVQSPTVPSVVQTVATNTSGAGAGTTSAGTGAAATTSTITSGAGAGTISAGTGAGTTSAGIGVSATISSGSVGTTSAAQTSSSSAVALKTSAITPSGTSAGPAQSTSAAPPTSHAGTKQSNGALVVILLALTGNLIFLI